MEWRLKCKGVRRHGGLEDYLEIWRIACFVVQRWDIDVMDACWSEMCILI